MDPRHDGNMMNVVVAPATVDEWPAISALREAYFSAWGVPLQHRGDFTKWVSARIGERVVGCYSYEDVEALRQRYVTDFYRVPGRDGARAFSFMLADIIANAERDNLDILAAHDPRNHGVMLALSKRRFEPVAVVMRLALHKEEV